MPLIIPEGYAQVVLTHYADSTRTGEWVTTIGFGEPLGPFPTTLQVAADAIYNQWVEDVVPLMSTSTGIRRVEVFNDVEGAVAQADVGGTRGGALPPPNATLVVDKNTSRRSRRAQGRMALYGMVLEDDVSDAGFLDTLTRTTIQTALAAWYSETTAALGCPGVILQNSEGISPPLSPPPVIESLDVLPQMGSMRRRMRR